MRIFILFIFTSTFATGAYAQEQLALRVNEQGILKVLKMAIQYNTATKASRTFSIPQNLYKFTIPKSQLNAMPIIPVLNELSNLNLNRDLDFYLNSSEIKISGTVDAKSLKTTILNSSSSGFDLRISINLPEVTISAPKLSLCEDRAARTKKCGTGLQASISNVSVKTYSKPVIVSALLRIKTSGNVARVSVRSVQSNLDDKVSPKLNIGIGSITVPRIAIVIDGQETELDTSKLKQEILNRKSFLSKKLLDFAGEFVAGDLAEMLNVYIADKSVATSIQVYRKDERNFNELSPHQDGVYVRTQKSIDTNDQNPIDIILKEVSRIVRNAKAEISLKKMSTPSNKDIELLGVLNFVLNNKKIVVGNNLGNSFRTLPKLDLTKHRKNDINLAISEPLINGALDLANSTKLFQEVFAKVSPVKGFSIKNAKLHFAPGDNLVAVINAEVNLNKIEASGVTGWFKRTIASWLERNNNNSIIYFPIEVAVKPVFKTIKGGEVAMELIVGSPFGQKTLVNTFGYPTNVPAMTDTVREGVMDELRGSLEEFMNKTYKVNISDYLNQSGVVFAPQSISIDQEAYLLINLNITDIKFNSANPNKR